MSSESWCPAPSDRLISIPTAAKSLGVTTVTLRRMMERGEGPPAVQISPRRWGIQVSALRQWIAGRTCLKAAPLVTRPRRIPSPTPSPAAEMQAAE